MAWQLGRVTDVHPHSDNIVRDTVKIQVVLKRPNVKVVKLPV